MLDSIIAMRLIHLRNLVMSSSCGSRYSAGQPIGGGLAQYDLVVLKPATFVTAVRNQMVAKLE